MNRARALTLGLVSAFVVITGVIMGVLFHQLLVIRVSVSGGSLDESWGNIDYGSSPVWLLSLVYVIPGAIGIIAALVQNKCLYILTCIFGVISLLIMGFIFVFVGYAMILVILAYGHVSENCYTDYLNQRCMCNVDSDFGGPNATPFATCDDLSEFIALFIGFSAMVVLAWLSLFVTVVICIYYCCRSETPSSQGAVFVPAQQPMIQPGSQQYPPPQAYYDQPPPSKV